MGTASDWITVALIGCFGSLCKLLSTAYKGKVNKTNPGIDIFDLLLVLNFSDNGVYQVSSD